MRCLPRAEFQSLGAGYCCVPTTPRSRLQVEGRAQAAIHVERHRRVQMHDLPRAAYAIEADRVAQPKAERLAGSLRSRQAGITLRVGDVAADAQRVAARLEVDRSFPGIEPRLLLFEVDAAMKQRR